MTDPLEIKMYCSGCGRTPAECGDDPCENQRIEGFMPVRLVPEAVVEEMRAEHLKANTIDADAEELGPSAPDVPDGDEQIKAVAEEALANPIDENAASPADALG